jgi:hypothetical protein
LKLRFDEALSLFPDHYFDFIYVDGYAHTGEEGGRTFHDWYPKLKPGGILAGKDYTICRPLVVAAVNAFVREKNLKSMLILPSKEARAESMWSEHPTWLARKPGRLSRTQGLVRSVNRRLDRWLGKRIAVVGNGPIDHGMASEIDDHDIVVRFNACSNYGTSGRKTDILILVNTGGSGLRLSTEPDAINRDALEASKTIWLTVAPGLAAEFASHTDLVGADHAELMRQNRIGSRCWSYISRESFLRAADHLEALGAEPPALPSSGFVTISHLLHTMPRAKLTLYGFTFEGWDKHPWCAEKAFVLAAGKSVKLRPA